MKKIVLTFVSTVVAGPALAHVGHSHDGGFASGFLHPVGGADHLLAMVAVGILASLISGRAIWLLPAAFVTAMIAGFGIGHSGFDLPYVETMIAASSLAFGLAIIFGSAIPAAVAVAVVASFAVFHGFAHGSEMPSGVSSLAYVSGFAIATALLHAMGVGASTALGRWIGTNGQLISRLSGAVVAAGGIGFLGGWL